MKAKVITGMALAAVMTSGCMGEDDPNRRAKMGAIAGAIGGAVIGHQIQGDHGRYIGAALGALAGGAVGNYMDKQHRELRRALEDELRADYVTLERIDKDT
ncbi:MAG: glycine zipper 2TM domain-containing protein, partial [Pseudomonadota bacterium]|nr:glycine zipper 2TM domain-containing protein [Pseudomonadota bacterium]